MSCYGNTGVVSTTDFVFVGTEVKFVIWFTLLFVSLSNSKQ